jgi:DNA repair protein RadA/Sms
VQHQRVWPATPHREWTGYKSFAAAHGCVEQACRFELGDQDIFANVIGGLHITEPAADLAAACSIASSMRDVPVAVDLAIIGEVGLSGELRTVGQLPSRLNEAAKLGFARALIPKTHRASELPQDKIEIVTARSVNEALALALVKK